MHSNYNRQQPLKGTLLTVISLTVVSLAMFFIRSHISFATTALVLVIPVILGVTVGGFEVGIVGIILGFLIYDYVFIPPYYTLTVGATQNWIALGVYVIVVLIVSRVVSNLKNARSYALEREHHARQLFELSKSLMGEKKLPQLLETIVSSVQSTFNFDSVVLLLEADGKLEIASHAGKPLNDADLQLLIPDYGEPATLRKVGGSGQNAIISLALTAGGKPVGLLAILGNIPDVDSDTQLLATFANNAALAIEQAQLKEQVLKTELLEEKDRWRRAILGSVSHDLRTPLASIKAAASALHQTDAIIADALKDELFETILTQTDRLTRLVVNLLDITRIEAGVLQPNLAVVEISELIEEGISALGGSAPVEKIRIEGCSKEHFVIADHILIAQVIANLLDNALRYSPNRELVSIEIRENDSKLFVSVNDSGPGVPKEVKDQIFEMFQQDSSGGRAGLGLAIAKAFIDAHQAKIEVDDSQYGGARFTFSLPAVKVDDTRLLQ